jgi:hypothetical protein
MAISSHYLYLAGILHLGVASANIFAFGKFHYWEHLEKLPRIMKQIFLVQNAYLMLIQVGFALLCFFFPEELTSGQSLPRAITGFLALFWGSRVLLQFFYYDAQLRKTNRLFDVLFILADSYLAGMYAYIALFSGSEH